jgi:hypothetical protein
MSQGPYDESKVKNFIINSRSEKRCVNLFMREFLLYSLKAGDLGVCKVNLTKELEEACSGVECNSLV